MESSPSVAAARGDKNAGEENGSSSMRKTECMLRLLPMSLCIVSLVLMLSNSQSSDDFGLLSYSNLGAFRFVLWVSCRWSILQHIYICNWCLPCFIVKKSLLLSMLNRQEAYVKHSFPWISLVRVLDMNNMTDLISKKIRTREKDCFTDDRLTLCDCRYLVQASGVCAGYSFLSACLGPSTSLNHVSSLDFLHPRPGWIE